MSWYNPFSWFTREKVKVVTVPKCGHKELASEFFWMSIGHQLQVLHYLGVPYAEQSTILASAKPFKDVADLMGVQDEPCVINANGTYRYFGVQMTPELYVARLKAVYDDNRRWDTIACLQNIFRDQNEAAYYADKLKDWKG